MISLVLYGGILALLAGILGVMFPLPKIGWSRRLATMVVVLGAASLELGLVWPPGRERPASGTQILDRFMPVYDINEVSSIMVRAKPADVEQAIRSVRPSEVRFLSTLFWLRSLPSGRPAPIVQVLGDRPLAPEPGQPGGYVLLARRPEHEWVVGAAGRFWELRGAPLVGLAGPEEFRDLEARGLAKAAINVRIEERGEEGCRVFTETRVLAMDEEDRKRFLLYWKLIHPGSAMLRLSWLQAVRQRAERTR